MYIHSSTRSSNVAETGVWSEVSTVGQKLILYIYIISYLRANGRVCNNIYNNNNHM